MTIKLTYDEWYDKYRPIANPASPVKDDIIFETYGNDVDFLNKQNPLCIWTDLDGDECNFIASGAHFVNRICYYITEVPFEEGEPIEVLIRYYDDEEGDEDNWRD
jgi:hypothetical protein